MKIAEAGWRYIGAGLAADAVGVGLLAGGVLGGSMPLLALGALASFLATAYTAFAVYFFRDPERALPDDPLRIYSPGDGVVLSVAREGAGDAVTLRVFLSPFDVHIQRFPFSGEVESVERHAGSLVAAMKPEAKHNARVVMRIKPDRREPLVVEQIAGFIARRIECWAKPGDRLKSGERYGIIHFGSQAAVHFPSSARCTVRPGERVVGGITPIGEWTN